MLIFVPGGPIYNKLWLVYVMALVRTGDKQLAEQIMALFTDAYMSLIPDEWNGVHNTMV